MIAVGCQGTGFVLAPRRARVQHEHRFTEHEHDFGRSLPEPFVSRSPSALPRQRGKDFVVFSDRATPELLGSIQS
jgi:hypothetical protein